MKIGVFLARFQPLHKSHEYIIRKVMKENDKAYVFIGSAQKSRQKRNPFNLEERLSMFAKEFEKEIKNGELIIVPLDDYSSEDDRLSDREWGEYLYFKIVNKIGQNCFSLYYSDEPSIMLNWFSEDRRKYIDFVFLNRKDIFSELSATKIRSAILNDDETYLKENLSEEVYMMRGKLKHILEGIYSE